MFNYYKYINVDFFFFSHLDTVDTGVGLQISLHNMKLTDLNIDCLEGILEYVKIRDLFNVADSNKRLRHASKFVFLRKYGICKFRFICESKSIKPRPVRWEELIRINDLKSILQLLRNFGALIYGIIYYDFNHKNTGQYIIDYINEFCSASLEEIFISMYDHFILNRWKKPFTRLKIITIKVPDYIRPNNNDCLIRLFPKLQNLTLFSKCAPQCFIHSGYIANHFPHLEYFTLNGRDNRDCKKDEKCTKMVKTFLIMNPQLKYFHMECANQSEINILQMFDERKHSPENLALRDVGEFTKCLNEEKPIHLPNTKKLSLELKYSIMRKIPLLCDRLETFEMNVYFDSGSSPYLLESIYDFCHNHSLIKKLKINFGISKIINFSRLAQLLPLLEEITCRQYQSIDIAIEVVNLFKSLKYVCFYCLKRSECKELQSRLNGDWSVEIKKISAVNNYIITLKRLI